jgi:hypothetical protein
LILSFNRLCGKHRNASRVMPRPISKMDKKMRWLGPSKHELSDGRACEAGLSVRGMIRRKPRC